MSLNDDHPAVRAVDARIADCAKRRAAFEARVSAMAAADNAKVARYDAALQTALLDGGATPEPPVLQLGTADVEPRQAFIEEAAQLQRERTQAQANAHPEVLTAAHAEALKLVTAARAPYSKLVDMMGQIGQLMSAATTGRDAANSLNGNSFTHYQDRRWDMAEFVRCIANQADPFELLDLNSRDDDSQPAQNPVQPKANSRVGMVSGGIPESGRPLNSSRA